MLLSQINLTTVKLTATRNSVINLKTELLQKVIFNRIKDEKLNLIDQFHGVQEQIEG